MWLADVRRRKRSGRLDDGRIRQLDKLGFAWEPKNQHWEHMFAELVAYRAKHGDCNVPTYGSENPRLGSWVQYQRYARKLNTLAQEHRERLEKIGFVWTPTKAAWESKYAALVKYQRAQGHCRVSKLSKDHASLGNWVRTMREYRKRGKLSEERIRRLTQLGFEWDGTVEARAEEAWESKYAALVEYQRTHGHCRVPNQSKDLVSLYNWIGTMRRYRKRGKLSEERIRRLTQLGFRWDSRKPPTPKGDK
ncbi:MAG: helicase associated domain-containing protein [Thermoguttaceae bacterium]